MTLDLAQFHDTFFAESFEALDSMEAALLKLSAGDADLELINTIFRVAHSIKGGARPSASPTSPASRTRSRRCSTRCAPASAASTPALVDTLLRSCDLMREMLGATQDEAGHRQGPRRRAARRDRAHHGHAAEQSPRRPAAAPAPAIAPGAAVRRAAQRLAHPLRARPQTTAQRQRSAAHAARAGDARRPARCASMPSGCRRWPSSTPRNAGCPGASRSTGRSRKPRSSAVFDWVEGECDLNTRGLRPRGGRHRDGAGAQTTRRRGIRHARSPSAAAVPAACAAGGSAPPAEEAPRRQPSRRAAVRGGSGDGGSIRVSIEKIDELLNSVGELVITQSVLSQLAAPLEGRDAEELRSALGQLERHMRALQESVMRVRMLPISFVFNRFPRLVRDLGQKPRQEDRAAPQRRHHRARQDRAREDRRSAGAPGAQCHRPRHRDARGRAWRPGKTRARHHRAQRLSQGRQRHRRSQRRRRRPQARPDSRQGARTRPGRSPTKSSPKTASST